MLIFFEKGYEVLTMQPSPRIPSRLDSASVAKYYDTTNDWIPGWTEQAERWNGRLAMVGFVISIATEALVGHSVFASTLAQWLGLR
jgi:hypothetical protein